MLIKNFLLRFSFAAFAWNRLPNRPPEKDAGGHTLRVVNSPLPSFQNLRSLRGVNNILNSPDYPGKRDRMAAWKNNMDLSFAIFGLSVALAEGNLDSDSGDCFTFNWSDHCLSSRLIAFIDLFPAKDVVRKDERIGFVWSDYFFPFLCGRYVKPFISSRKVWSSWLIVHCLLRLVWLKS